MILFWLICAGLVAIALAFVLPPLLERVPTDAREDEKKEANLDIYRDQLAELAADMRNGIISPEQHQQDRELAAGWTAEPATNRGKRCSASEAFATESRRRRGVGHAGAFLHRSGEIQ